jgi:large subunit ribosomal protein L21
MFAVIKTGGKQFRVAANDTLKVGKLDAKPGEIVTFPVAMVGGDKPVIGSPLVSDATVAAEVVDHQRGAKVIAFKKRRRQNSKRKRGYRNDFTLVRITEILTGGKKPDMTARQPKAKKAKAEGAGAEKPKAKAKTPAKKAKK